MKRQIALTSAFAAALLILVIGGYFFLGQPAAPTDQNAATTGGPQETLRPEAQTGTEPAQPPAYPGNDDSLLARLLGPATDPNSSSLPKHLARVTLSLSLAALLAAALAFRPHWYRRLLKRNPYVAPTQILLATVAAALMMIVGDSAARAFGIFAAASLVRFRTNIRDPKQITVLLVNLAIGLAAGVGQWGVAIVLFDRHLRRG